jgi:hypothetical protein
MGSRADFYVGGPHPKQEDWLGSIAWDGYPDGIPDEILKAKTEEEYKAAVLAFLKGRKDATFPEMGWPWPWEDSDTTDFAYTWWGEVNICCFGRGWIRASDPRLKEDDVFGEGNKPGFFPNMKNIQKVDMGSRSGVIVLGFNPGVKN